MRLRNPVLLGLVCGASLALAVSLQAAIFPSETGKWPDDWPEALEAYRQQATTLGVGTGVQENVYTITFENREDFEKIWPVVLKLKTPGSPLRLYRTSEEKHPTWGRLLSNAKPSLRIYAPSEGYASDGAIDRDALQRRRDELLDAGRILHASAPWPEYLTGADGSLPEYVVAVKGDDGRMRWEPGEPGDEHRGFYHRARVDVELVVDGRVIDLNRIRFPESVELIDRR